MMGEILGIQELWLFVLSGLLLNVTPGPDTAYIIGRSIQLGWRGGAAAAFGISGGCLVHVFGAAIGLSALLMASSAAFAVVKLAGAAYLLFSGVQMLLSRPRPMTTRPVRSRYSTTLLARATPTLVMKLRTAAAGTPRRRRPVKSSLRGEAEAIQIYVRQ